MFNWTLEDFVEEFMSTELWDCVLSKNENPQK